MHILFLIDELCRKGGAEAALQNAVRWLPRERFRCSVITFRLDERLPMLAEFACPVRLLPLRCVYDANAMRQAWRLARFIRRERVDIVHTFFASSDLWGGAVTKLAGRARLVSSRRDMGFQRQAKHRFGYRLMAPHYDRVLAVCEQVRGAMIDSDGLKPEQVETIYNSVDCSRMPKGLTQVEARRRLELPASAPVIAAVGNLRRVKGFDVLMHAAAAVCRNCPNAVFAIAGGEDPSEPDLRRQLLALSRELGIAENVRFLGRVEDVFPLLIACDLFCMLSRTEGFSNALLEAMACARPVVATRVGGNGEAIEEGVSGFLVESENHAEAAERMIMLLRDPELTRSMGAHGRKRVLDRFSPGAVMAQWIAVYESLMASRGVRR
jgi:glycosyltransferase involved in cell wall biosynthesis